MLHSLIKASINGDHDAYRKIVDQYTPLILNLCYRFVHNEMDALDITQEVLIKVYKELDAYNPQYAFTTWLYKITTNSALDYIRKQKRYRLLKDRFFHEIEFRENNSYELSAEAYIIKEERFERIQSYIHSLSIKYQSVIILYYFENLNQGDIAKVLEIPIGTVHSRLNTAKKQLRKIIGEEMEALLYE